MSPQGAVSSAVIADGFRENAWLARLRGQRELAIGSRLVARAFSFVIGQPIRETLCLLFGPARLSLKIREIPVHYQAGLYGTTNIRRWQHGVLLCRMLIKGFLRFKLERAT